MANPKGLLASLAAKMAREKVAASKFPAPVIFKTAGGLGITKLGLVKAYTMPNGIVWGTTHAPVEMTPTDAAEYEELMAAYRILNAKTKRLKEKAYKRGRVISLEEAAKMTEAVEGAI